MHTILWEKSAGAWLKQLATELLLSSCRAQFCLPLISLSAELNRPR